MTSTFLLYGANGYVGEAAARMAVESGLRPVLAGRDAAKIEKLAAELGLECRIFDLQDPIKIKSGLNGMAALLHCAGPYLYTSQPMVDACLQTGTHYLDITGEIPVYEAVARRDAEAKARGVMLLPGTGFDVVPTDCLALHLKQRLPSATHLALAFQSEGPAGLPPGTQKTAIELMNFGDFVRKDGALVAPAQAVKTRAVKTRWIDFGQGPVLASRLTWGDVFTAYHSTSIPNIEDYIVMLEANRKQMAMLAQLRPLLKWAPLRNLVKRGVQPGPTAEQRAQTFVHVWGEVEDQEGHKVVARLHGPEAGVIWTVRAALASVRKVLSGSAPAGYQTPATAYGADFVLECEGVSREDVE
jgi:short subunit dehydrogenase-like uncharacterized protein